MRCATSKYLNRIHIFSTPSSSDHFFVAQHFSTSFQSQDEKSIESILRVTLVAEEAATALFHGKSKFSNSLRPDIHSLLHTEQHNLQEVKTLCSQHKASPSALIPPTKAAFTILGVISQVLPRQTSDAILAGVADALTHTYNEHLRQLHQINSTTRARRPSGNNTPGNTSTYHENSRQNESMKRLMRSLRDTERVPDGSPEVPDILSLSNVKELSPERGIAGIVKLSTKAILDLSQKM